MKRQREKKNYWDYYKDYILNSSFDKLYYNKLSLNSLSFNDKKDNIIKDSRKKKYIYKGLRDNKRKILLENNKNILKPI